MGKRTPLETRNNFASSPMPNQRITRGIKARLGIFLHICRVVSNIFSETRNNPFTSPKIKPILPPITNPVKAREALILKWVASSPDCASFTAALITVVGAGRMRVDSHPNCTANCQRITRKIGNSQGTKPPKPFCT